MRMVGIFMRAGAREPTRIETAKHRLHSVCYIASSVVHRVLRSLNCGLGISTPIIPAHGITNEVPPALGDFGVRTDGGAKTLKKGGQVCVDRQRGGGGVDGLGKGRILRGRVLFYVVEVGFGADDRVGGRNCSRRDGTRNVRMNGIGLPRLAFALVRKIEGLRLVIDLRGSARFTASIQHGSAPGGRWRENRVGSK